MPDRATLEQRVSAIVRTWTDALAEALAAGARAAAARRRCSRATATRSPTAIASAYSPTEAVDDIRVIEGLIAERPLGVDFYRAHRRTASRASA